MVFSKCRIEHGIAWIMMSVGQERFRYGFCKEQFEPHSGPRAVGQTLVFSRYGRGRKIVCLPAANRKRLRNSQAVHVELVQSRKAMGDGCKRCCVALWLLIAAPHVLDNIYLVSWGRVGVHLGEVGALNGVCKFWRRGSSATCPQQLSCSRPEYYSVSLDLIIRSTV